MKKVFKEKPLVLIYSLCILLTPVYSVATPETQSNLGGWAIPVDLFRYICTNLKPGSTILEFGSGSGTQELSKHYTMYSIEHEKYWLDKYDTNYIYAPIKNYGNYRWYNIEAIIPALPKEYDLILVDGPTGTIGRYGFIHHLEWFNIEVPIIFDDIQRKPEKKLLTDMAKKLGRKFTVHRCPDGKAFGVIFPAN